MEWEAYELEARYQRMREREARASGVKCPYCGEPMAARYRCCDNCMIQIEAGIDIGDESTQ